MTNKTINARFLFFSQGRLDKAVITLVIIINTIVLFNSIFHDPVVGYDAFDHRGYIKVMPLRLPTHEDIRLFYSPPLPYFFPSIAHLICEQSGIANCVDFAAKVAQIINFFVSIAISFVFLSIAELLKPGDRAYKLALLGILSLETVYYRTFSQVRGEPYVALFIAMLSYWILVLLRNRKNLRLRHGIVLGFIMGLLILSRQWGAFTFPALIIIVLIMWVREKKFDVNIAKIIVIGCAVAFIVGGWFYIRLAINYGTFTPFSLESKGFHFSNQPPLFYRATGLKEFRLFKQPIRRNFDNLLIPIFYSDTWGDYWGYFTFIKLKSPHGGENENSQQIAPYLGRVNLVSLLPSFLMALAMAREVGSLFRIRSWDDSEGIERLFRTFIAIAVLLSLAGFFWFVVSYPEPPDGSTIKASYIIQIFILLPILVADFLHAIYIKSSRLYWTLMGLILLVFAHNIPAFLTRQIAFLYE